MTEEDKYLDFYRGDFAALKERTKNSFREFFRHLSGISTPLGGISWTLKEGEKEVIYGLIQRLAHHRLAIRIGHEGLSYSKVIASLETMREQVTEVLVQLGPDFSGRDNLERIRTAFQQFQGLVENEFPRELDKEETHSYRNLRGIFIETCVAMQEAVGTNVAILVQNYSIELSDDLKRSFGMFENR